MPAPCIRISSERSSRHVKKAPPLKIAIASVFDPRRPDSWSGCSHHLLRSLEEDYGVSVIVLGPLEISNPFYGRLESRYHRARGRNYRPELTERSLRSFARASTRSRTTFRAVSM